MGGSIRAANRAGRRGAEFTILLLVAATSNSIADLEIETLPAAPE
jgi:hypothetical protein